MIRIFCIQIHGYRTLYSGQIFRKMFILKIKTALIDTNVNLKKYI